MTTFQRMNIRTADSLASAGYICEQADVVEVSPEEAFFAATVLNIRVFHKMAHERVPLVYMVGDVWVRAGVSEWKKTRSTVTWYREAQPDEI